MHSSITLPLASLLASLLGSARGAPADFPHLAWSDEFKGTQVDPTKWGFQIGQGCDLPAGCGWGNGELEYYTEENAVVKDGMLNIIAKKEPSPDGLAGYTSVRMWGKGKASFLYGRFEARIKFPSAEGAWPAFWMLPEDSPYGGWAASGEIDIVESKNECTDAQNTIHFGGEWPGNDNSNNYEGGECHKLVTTGGFHVYAIEWSPDSMTWFIDGKETCKKTTWYSALSKRKTAPFDVPFYMLLNLAIGGMYTEGAIVDDSKFPLTMQVDYVRVYQNSDGNGGGNGGGKTMSTPAPSAVDTPAPTAVGTPAPSTATVDTPAPSAATVDTPAPSVVAGTPSPSAVDTPVLHGPAAATPAPSAGAGVVPAPPTQGGGHGGSGVGESYMGCYGDAAERDLAGAMVKMPAESASMEMCSAFCSALGFGFFGLQYGDECYCDDKYGSYGEVSDAECSFPCTGDVTATCGGDWANSVFKVDGGAYGATDFSYLGCFHNDENQPDLDGVSAFLPPDVAHPRRCAEFCDRAAYKYAAMEMGYLCSCGNSYGRYGEIDMEQCSAACLVDAPRCGGDHANAVMAIQ